MWLGLLPIANQEAMMRDLFNIDAIVGRDREEKEDFYLQLSAEELRLKEDVDYTLKVLHEHLPVMSIEYGLLWEDGERYLEVVTHMAAMEYDHELAEKIRKKLQNGPRRSNIKILVGFRTHHGPEA